MFIISMSRSTLLDEFDKFRDCALIIKYAKECTSKYQLNSYIPAITSRLA